MTIRTDGVDIFPTTDRVDKFPRTYDIHLINSTHVETVCLLSNRKSKPDSYVDLSINMEDYHRIKNEEK